jgi:hypothetical protein
MRKKEAVKMGQGGGKRVGAKRKSESALGVVGKVFEEGDQRVFRDR